MNNLASPKHKENKDMQCYQYLAAITAVANCIESAQGPRHKMPYNVIADWMEANDIDVQDVLLVSGDEVKAIVADLIEQSQPTMPHAA